MFQNFLNTIKEGGQGVRLCVDSTTFLLSVYNILHKFDQNLHIKTSIIMAVTTVHPRCYSTWTKAASPSGLSQGLEEDSFPLHYYTHSTATAASHYTSATMPNFLICQAKLSLRTVMFNLLNWLPVHRHPEGPLPPLQMVIDQPGLPSSPAPPAPTSQATATTRTSTPLRPSHHTPLPSLPRYQSWMTP